MIEALKFGLLAVEHLPDGADREAAKKNVREARKALSRDEFQLAIDAARLWKPLERPIVTLSAKDEV